MKLYEVLAGVDPDETEQVIQKSFKDRVVSDLVADASLKGDIPSSQIVQQIKQKFPSITKNVNFRVEKGIHRIRIMFGDDGAGTTISLPEALHPDLGEVLVVHELAHMLYTKDLLTNKIVKYRNASEAFTILRVLEDVAIERRMEKEHPGTVDVFKRRAPHAIQAISNSQPSRFASSVDQLFLTLRGYTNRKYQGSTEALKYAERYLSSDNDEDKIDAVLNIADIFTR